MTTITPEQRNRTRAFVKTMRERGVDHHAIQKIFSLNLNHISEEQVRKIETNLKQIREIIGLSWEYKSRKKSMMDNLGTIKYNKRWEGTGRHETYGT